MYEDWPLYWLIVIRLMYLAVIVGVPITLIGKIIVDQLRYSRKLKEAQAVEVAAVIEGDEAWNPLTEHPVSSRE